MLRRQRDRVERARTDPEMRVWIRVVALVALGAYVVAFVVENSKVRPLHFVFATAHISLDYVIVLMLAIGIVVGVLLSQLVHRRSRRQVAAAPQPPAPAHEPPPTS